MPPAHMTHQPARGGGGPGKIRQRGALRAFGQHREMRAKGASQRGEEARYSADAEGILMARHYNLRQSDCAGGPPGDQRARGVNRACSTVNRISREAASLEQVLIKDHVFSSRRKSSGAGRPPRGVALCCRPGTGLDGSGRLRRFNIGEPLHPEVAELRRPHGHTIITVHARGLRGHSDADRHRCFSRQTTPAATPCGALALRRGLTPCLPPRGAHNGRSNRRHDRLRYRAR